MKGDLILPAISVSQLHKSFRVYADGSSTLKDRLLFRHRRKYRLQPVLRGVSLEIRKGEAVALIGRNGCGKSTLLKLISRILYPDAGSVQVHGRVSSLLELGAGFHPEMTGRENIFTNASVFGLSRSEIRSRLQEIIDFSRLGDAIDRPVRTYSSGMYMRLAFAVAIHVGADILLIDEILAVGDAAFQAKCMERLLALKAQGVTIVIVSHSMSQLERICDRSIWLEQGEICMDGPPGMVHPYYLEQMGRQNQPCEQPPMPSSVHLTGGRLLDAKGEPTARVAEDTPLTLCLHYQTTEDACVQAAVTVAVYRSDALLCWSSNTTLTGEAAFHLHGTGMLQCEIDMAPLANGQYWVDAALRHPETNALLDAAHRMLLFSVEHSTKEKGVVHLPHRWK